MEEEVLAIMINKQNDCTAKCRCIIHILRGTCTSYLQKRFKISFILFILLHES